jgi:hypothetical protein
MKDVILHLSIATGYAPMELTAMFIAHSAFGTIALAIKLSFASKLPVGRWGENSANF